MKFEIIGTGSSGNCFLINKNVMIDCGLPYSRIKDKIKDVKCVLLSHIHGDHFNMATIRKIIVAINPFFVCGEWLKDDLLKIADIEKVKILTSNSHVLHFLDYKIAMIEAYHDVPNCGYRIMRNGDKHMHITDTYTLDGIEARGYGSASIECNHETEKALHIIEEAKKNGEFSHLNGAINSHLSVEKTINFCKENGIKRLYPIHIGSSTKKEVIQKLKEW